MYMFNNRVDISALQNRKPYLILSSYPFFDLPVQTPTVNFEL
jgi:hypothetical protein